MNSHFLILYFLFSFVFIASCLLVIGVILKAHMTTGRTDMLYLLAGFILISLSGISLLMASALELIVMPGIVMPLIISIFVSGFLLVSYSFAK